MTSISLKSAQISRIDVGRADQLYSTSRTLGWQETCPTSAQNLYFDVYGRPATEFTLNKQVAECDTYQPVNARKRIAFENFHRPSVLAATPSLPAMTADFGGLSRNFMPRGLYGDQSGRGEFARIYRGVAEVPPTMNSSRPAPQQERRVPNYTGSMDASLIKLHANTP